MTNFKTEIKRINGHLKEVVTFLDDSGDAIGHALNPLMVELKPRDITQIFVGSLLISAPLCFTEEVWNIGMTIEIWRTVALAMTSVLAVMSFIYFNFYRYRLKGHVIEYFKRVMATYFISTLSTIFILFIIDKLPYETSPVIAFNRVVIISFPSIFGAMVTDYLK